VLIAEDLLLLLLDDESGAPQSNFMQLALGGALLVELAMDGCVDVGTGGRWRSAKVSVIDGAPAPVDPLLAAGLALVGEKERTAQSLVDLLGKDVQRPLADRLVERGILERRDSRVLGLFPRHRWPTVNATHEDELRRSLAAALVAGQSPDQWTAALVALLLAVDRVDKSVEHGGLKSRDVKRRAKEIAEGNWAAQGVRDAVAAATAATTAAIVAATSAASVSATS